jgi:hypothetical protein
LYGTNLFTGSLVAWGGNGSARGGAGTICLQNKNQSERRILIDNGGQPGAVTLLGSYDYGVDVAVTGGGNWLATYYPGSLKNVLIGSNSCLVVSNQYQSQLLTVSSLVGAKGWRTSGGWAGFWHDGAGGYVPYQIGYIGAGGIWRIWRFRDQRKNARGLPYGSIENPTDAGSRGGYYYSYAAGGAGGGAIRLTVTDLLNVEGRISANGVSGTNSGAGGGSGGSILLNGGTLAGSGIISANGGPGIGLGGGGGGGRISIQYSVNAFNGVISAYGGYGGLGEAVGGAGTVYLKSKSQPVYGTLIIDNGGKVGTNTLLSGLSGGAVVIQGGGVAMQSGPLTLASLTVASNGCLLATNQMMSVSGNASVMPGGSILADGGGYQGGAGPGAGYPYSLYGYGFTAGGAGYGVTVRMGLAPRQWRQQLRLDDRSNRPGSAAGDLDTHLWGQRWWGVANECLRHAARRRANHCERHGWTVPGAGGGSGGSVWITAETLAGEGSITADGGAGNGWGRRLEGGLRWNSPELVCGSARRGGWPRGNGLWWRGNDLHPPLESSGGQVFVDNGGRRGTNTPLPIPARPWT